MSKKESLVVGSVIGAGDEGGPVFNSLLLCDVSDPTSWLTEKVGHMFGDDTTSVSDRVLMEHPKLGCHETMGEGKLSMFE